MRLFKAHGLGNDYLVWEGAEEPALTAAVVRRLCDRHEGVGGDGLLEPRPSARATFGVRIWNPDGSIAEKSGNGLRIYAYWRARRGAGPAFTVDTGFAVVGCEVRGPVVDVEMGQATVGHATTLVVEGHPLAVTPIDVGNPHAVVWRDPHEDLDALPWRAWGAALERDVARFPHRTNVQFAKLVAPGTVEARIWERGAGETRASGSSACAVAVEAVRRGLHASGGPLTVVMPGGELTVTVRDDLTLRLVGPVAPIATITLDEAWPREARASG